MIKEILYKVLSKGVRRNLRALRMEYRIMQLHRKGVKKIASSKFTSPLKLHIGCGPVSKKGWLNIDMFNPSADVNLDLRERLPFPYNSCSIIYSEHVLEHIAYPHDVEYLLGECFRVLIPQGVFSVGVPDTAWPLEAYHNDSDNYFLTAKQEHWHPGSSNTKMEHINYHFRQGGEHLFAYDYETLQFKLEQAGFINIKQREFNPDLDSQHRSKGTLYVDCNKP